MVKSSHFLTVSSCKQFTLNYWIKDTLPPQHPNSCRRLAFNHRNPLLFPIPKQPVGAAPSHPLLPYAAYPTQDHAYPTTVTFFSSNGDWVTFTGAHSDAAAASTSEHAVIVLPDGMNPYVGRSPPQLCGPGWGSMSCHHLLPSALAQRCTTTCWRSSPTSAGVKSPTPTPDPTPRHRYTCILPRVV
jgi:hypothetical protein